MRAHGHCLFWGWSRNNGNGKEPGTGEARIKTGRVPRGLKRAHQCCFGFFVLNAQWRSREGPVAKATLAGLSPETVGLGQVNRMKGSLYDRGVLEEKVNKHDCTKEYIQLILFLFRMEAKEQNCLRSYSELPRSGIRLSNSDLLHFRQPEQHL